MLIHKVNCFVNANKREAVFDSPNHFALALLGILRLEVALVDCRLQRGGDGLVVIVEPTLLSRRPALFLSANLLDQNCIVLLLHEVLRKVFVECAINQWDHDDSRHRLNDLPHTTDAREHVKDADCCDGHRVHWEVFVAEILGLVVPVACALKGNGPRLLISIRFCACLLIELEDAKLVCCVVLKVVVQAWLSHAPRLQRHIKQIILRIGHLFLEERLIIPHLVERWVANVICLLVRRHGGVEAEQQVLHQWFVDELGRHVRINECIDLVNTLGQVAFSPVTQLRKISRNVQLLDIQLCVRRKTVIFFELN